MWFGISNSQSLVSRYLTEESNTADGLSPWAQRTVPAFVFLDQMQGCFASHSLADCPWHVSPICVTRLGCPFRVSFFYFPVSIFQFRVSSFQFPLWQVPDFGHGLDYY